MRFSKQSPEPLPSSDEYAPTQSSVVSRLPVSRCSSIYKLPIEVLEIIFMFSTSNTNFGLSPYYYSQGECVRIALVCKWWGRIVERLLFSNIIGSLGTWPPRSEIRLIDKLLRLEEAPCHYNHVRLVRIFVDKHQATKREIGIVLRGLTACSNIRSLSLTWDFEDCIYPFLKCVEKLPLRCLRLQSLYHGISINAVSEFFNIPTLDQVSLGGYGWSKNDTLTIQKEEGTVGLTDEEVQGLSLPSFEQFRGVKIIHLMEPWTHPLVTQHLLSWPRRLEELSLFEMWEIEPYGSQYTSEAVVRLLDRHRGSLKKLWIDWVPSGQKHQIADFSEFTQLEHLYIPAHCLFHFPASEVWPRIIPPNLRSLVLDFTSDFRDIDASALFGENEFNWIKELLSTVRSKVAHSKLGEISINFGGRGDPRKFWREGSSYPHRYLVEAVEAARKYGVVLRYTEPVTYDEPWNVIARDMPPPVRFDDLDSDIYTSRAEQMM